MPDNAFDFGLRGCCCCRYRDLFQKSSYAGFWGEYGSFGNLLPPPKKWELDGLDGIQPTDNSTYLRVRDVFLPTIPKCQVNFEIESDGTISYGSGTIIFDGDEGTALHPEYKEGVSVSDWEALHVAYRFGTEFSPLGFRPAIMQFSSGNDFHFGALTFFVIDFLNVSGNTTLRNFEIKALGTNKFVDFDSPGVFTPPRPRQIDQCEPEPKCWYPADDKDSISIVDNTPFNFTVNRQDNPQGGPTKLESFLFFNPATNNAIPFQKMAYFKSAGVHLWVGAILMSGFLNIFPQMAVVYGMEDPNDPDTIPFPRIMTKVGVEKLNYQGNILTGPLMGGGETTLTAS